MTSGDPVPQVDYRATARRPQWSVLPDAVRTAVADAAGGSIASVDPSVTSGFSGGFAAVVRLTDGRRVFAKAGSAANPHLLEAYAREAIVLAGLPDAVPAPRLVGSALVDADGVAWQVVVVDVVRGEIPQPWTPRTLAAAHVACLRVTEALTPPPPGLTMGSLADAVAGELNVFSSIAPGAVPAGSPAWLRSRLPDLDALLGDAATALDGGTGMHNDLRADNLLVDLSVGEDTATIVDWNWLTRGPAWADFVGLLPPARADGLDVDAFVAASPLTRHVDPEQIDVFLAVVAAYMLRNAPLPLFPGGTPAIRIHQRRYARTFLDWLATRRGWTPVTPDV
jgi:Phosphotransferase enzyme family